MKTKISCLPVSLYKDFFSGAITVPDWSAHAQKLGLDAVDINALFLKEKTTQEISEIRSKLIVPVFMVSAYSDFTNPSVEKRAEALDAAVTDIYNSAAVGAEYIRLTAGQYHPDCKEDIMLQYIRDSFEKCVKISEETGVKILLENHSKPGAWKYPDYVFDTHRFINTVEALSDLPIRINFDTANAFALGDWKKILNTVREKIDTIHVNDLKFVSPLTFTLVGEGIVPIDEIVNAIYSTGFSGAVSLEEASFLGWYGIARGIDYTKNLCCKIEK